MILNFDIEVLAEDVLHLLRPFLGAVVISVQKELRHTPRKAGGKADHPLVVLFQKLIVDPRLAVKSVDIGQGIELYDILIARFILGEHDDVFRLCPGALVAIVVRGVKLAADNVFDPLLYALLGKIQRSVHIAVIGDRAAVYVVFDEVIDEVVHFGGSVEKAVFRV